MLQQWHIEIDQEPKSLIGKFEITDQLSFMNREQALYGFQLKDNLSFNKHIHHIFFVELFTLID